MIKNTKKFMEEAIWSVFPMLELWRQCLLGEIFPQKSFLFLILILIFILGVFYLVACVGIWNLGRIQFIIIIISTLTARKDHGIWMVESHLSWSEKRDARC